MSKKEQRTITKDEWMAEGTKLFGEDQYDWRFVCPSCGHVATPRDWRRVGAAEGEVAFSCIGRHMATAVEAFGLGAKKGPCNYAGGGFFRLNPVTVTEGARGDTLFEFAREPAKA